MLIFKNISEALVFDRG